ncbi:MAG: OsmC family protein [Betaproteobacteria bacterium]|nr:MAG: OsmC family protein [Betaproteobacteria bacterium]
MTTDNGVRKAIEQLTATFATEPGKARVTNAATARLTAGLRCEVSGPRSERMSTDMPASIGGKGSAPNPGWYLRAAVASCAATVIATRAAKLGITLGQLEVTVESEGDQRGLLGLDERISAAMGGWRMKVAISGDAPEQELRQLVAWADAHSPVGCTVREPGACALEVQVV